MADIIFPDKFKSHSSDAEVPAIRADDLRARREQFVTARERDRAKHAEDVRSKLKSNGRLDKKGVRPEFGERIFQLFKELDEMDSGLVGKVLREAIGGDEASSTKRRGRFAQRKGKPLRGTQLTADGAHWVRVVNAIANRLGRDPDQAILDLVAGTEFAPPSADVAVGDITDDAALTSMHLNALCGWVARKFRLTDYFTVLSRNDLVMTEAGELRVPAVLPQSADPHVLADGWWLPEEDAPVFPFLPKAKLYERSIQLPVVGTPDVSGKPHDDAGWNEVAALGTAPGTLGARLTVWLGVAPIGADRSPVACFIIRQKLEMNVWGQKIEIGYDPGRTWQEFSTLDSEAGYSWHAIRLVDHAPPIEAAGAGCFLTEIVTPATCSRRLADVGRYNDGVLPAIHGDLSDLDLDAYPDDGANPEPTAAPTRTMLSALQRNLAYSEGESSVATLLAIDAERLVGKVRDLQEQRREDFERAIAPLVNLWKGETDPS